MKDWQKVEAVLFGSGKYLTEEQIAQLSSIPKKNLKKVLGDLKKHYESIDSSLDVFNEGDSWKLNVKEDFAHIVKNVISEAEMSKPVMETLALIAYKSPVMQSEIIDSRGAGAYEYISLLEEKGFIQKDKFGRTFKIKITPKFFDYFDISGDSKLRQMFKNVKKPEKIGSLEVYTADKTPENQNGEEFTERILERMKKVEHTPDDHEEKKKFLENFDSKFSKTKTDIDETDKEMNEFRKIAPHDGQVQDGQSSDSESESKDEADPDRVLARFEEVLDKLDSENSKEDEQDAGEGEAQTEQEETNESEPADEESEDEEEKSESKSESKPKAKLESKPKEKKHSEKPKQKKKK